MSQLIAQWEQIVANCNYVFFVIYIRKKDVKEFWSWRQYAWWMDKSFWQEVWTNNLQLVTEVEVNSGGYLPSREVAR